MPQPLDEARGDGNLLPGTQPLGVPDDFRPGHETPDDLRPGTKWHDVMPDDIRAGKQHTKSQDPGVG